MTEYNHCRKTMHDIDLYIGLIICAITFVCIVTVVLDDNDAVHHNEFLAPAIMASKGEVNVRYCARSFDMRIAFLTVSPTIMSSFVLSIQGIVFRLPPFMLASNRAWNLVNSYCHSLTANK